MNKINSKGQFVSAITTEVFIEKSKKRFGDKFDYSKAVYKLMKAPLILICPIHGEFNMEPKSHLNSKTGCDQCGVLSKREVDKLKGYTKFIENAENKFGNAFNYNSVSYTNNYTPVKIFCNTHNKFFLQSPSNHMVCKVGCEDCKKEKIMFSVKNGWSKSDWVNVQKNRVAKLYICKLKNTDFEFIKIGITVQSIKRRFRNILKTLGEGTTIEQLKVIESLDAAIIYDLEKKTKRDLKSFQKDSPIKFDGSTECYQLTLEVLDYIKNF